jgi:Ca-activated chloride channel family protein
MKKSASFTAEVAIQIALAAATGLAVSLALAGLVLLLAGSAQAAGGLQFKTSAGPVAAPLLATDVEIRVTGHVARATVRQSFRNPHADWYEGVYTFPLPENAAVDQLRMRVGERVVEGEIRERQAAKASYEQAKTEGRRATLVEQERPNIFTTSLANIGPGETIQVEIEYQQTLRYDQGRYALRFPMVVGPRYIPAGVEDAARITPAVLRPDENAAPINPVNLRVSLETGVPVGSVESAYHRIGIRKTGDTKQWIALAGDNYANKDFELAWTLAPGREPAAALFTEKKGGRHYGLLMVVPPAQERSGPAIPREAIFVIDTSGSMHGASIAQAREALELAIRRLSPADRFNVIEFNSTARALFGQARPADAASIDSAVRWVRELRAQGGTEMAKALDLALDGKSHEGRIRQIVFLTDGAVGNEDPLLRMIRERLGDSRLFTVGIGSAPNSHFMTKAAQFGAGTFTYIGRIEEVKQKMDALFAKLESPVLKGLTIDWGDSQGVQAWPNAVPDLYLGEPVVVLFSADSVAGEIKVAGMVARNTPLAEAGGLGTLWAREKISGLMDALRSGAPEEEVRPGVLKLALEHHLVSKYTSLVAVDKTPARVRDEMLKSAGMPTNLPEGWSYDAVYGAPLGELPRGATNARLNLLAGLLLLLSAWFLRRRLA